MKDNKIKVLESCVQKGYPNCEYAYLHVCIAIVVCVNMVMHDEIFKINGVDLVPTIFINLLWQDLWNLEWSKFRQWGEVAIGGMKNLEFKYGAWCCLTFEWVHFHLVDLLSLAIICLTLLNQKFHMLNR